MSAALGTSAPVVVALGSDSAGAPLLVAFAWGDVAGAVLLTGVTPLAGDLGYGDVNRDGHGDFVMVGREAPGAPGGIRLFEGSATGWTRRDIRALTDVSDADLDLADADGDGDLDLLVMLEHEVGGPWTPVRQRFAALYLWEGGAFVEADLPDVGLAGGDGHIVDIANDGLPDELALGADRTGLPASWLRMYRGGEWLRRARCGRT